MARDMRDEFYVNDNFDMVCMAMAMRRLTSLFTYGVTGDGAAKVCEDIARCDRLCSDEC